MSMITHIDEEASGQFKVKKQSVRRQREVMVQLRRNKYLYIMFFLPAVYFIIFHYIPMFGNLIAFENYNAVEGVFHSPWVGVMYFRQFLTDPYFWTVARNTILLNVYSLVFYFPVPIILALLINEVRHVFFKRFVQSVTYLPHFLSTVIVAGMIVNFLSYGGIVNQLIHFLGGHNILFLDEPQWFRTIYVGSDVWQSAGWGTIVYLAAMTGIDLEQYEAATIDGANRWKKTWYITLPGITPVITILFLLTLGQILSVGFEKVLLLYNGATYSTADVIPTYVYRRGLVNSDFSYATAVGLFQSVIGFFMVMISNKATKKIGETSLW